LRPFIAAICLPFSLVGPVEFLALLRLISALTDAVMCLTPAGAYHGWQGIWGREFGMWLKRGVKILEKTGERKLAKRTIAQEPPHS
jgi:hypothetical protein